MAVQALVERTKIFIDVKLCIDVTVNISKYFARKKMIQVLEAPVVELVPIKTYVSPENSQKVFFSVGVRAITSTN